MTTQVADNQLVDALRTVAINGAYNASRALSKWLKRGVRLTTDGFKRVPISEASSVVGDPAEPIAAIHLPLEGDLGGHMLLTFPEHVALQLADIMMQVPEGTSTEFTELEQSCLEETGNIVASVYANSLANWLNLKIKPGVPKFAHDMASSIVDPLLVDFATYHDELYMAATNFQIDGKSLQWGLLLLPSESALKLMESRCNSESMRCHALQTIAVNGAFNASRSVSKWLKRGVKLSTDGFQKIALNDVSCHLDDSIPILALHSQLYGQVKGHALLTITLDHAMHLADLLLGNPPGTTKSIGETEESCMQETGNILFSAYMNSWSTWLGASSEPGPPQCVIDLPSAVVQTVLSEQALMSDEVFMAPTSFVVDKQWLEWWFMLLPSPSTMRLIETSCQ